MRAACGSWLPHRAHPALGSRPCLASPPSLAKRWHKAAALNNSGFVLARVPAAAPCPLGCRIHSPLPPRCSGALAAPPWRRCFHSLPGTGRSDGEAPAEAPFVSPCSHGLSLAHTLLLMLLGLDADAGAGSCCTTQHHSVRAASSGRSSVHPYLYLCVCLCVLLPPSPVYLCGKQPHLLAWSTRPGPCCSVLGIGHLSVSLHGELSMQGVEVVARLMVLLWSSPPWVCCLF